MVKAAVKAATNDDQASDGLAEQAGLRRNRAARTGRPPVEDGRKGPASSRATPDMPAVAIALERAADALATAAPLGDPAAVRSVSVVACAPTRA